MTPEEKPIPLEEKPQSLSFDKRVKEIRKASPFAGCIMERLPDNPNRLAFKKFAYRAPTVKDWLDILKPKDMEEQISPPTVSMGNKLTAQDIEIAAKMAACVGQFDGEKWPESKVRLLPLGFLQTFYLTLQSENMIFMGEEESEESNSQKI